MKTPIALIALLFALAAGTVVATTSKPDSPVKTPPQAFTAAAATAFRERETHGLRRILLAARRPFSQAPAEAAASD